MLKRTCYVILLLGILMLIGCAEEEEKAFTKIPLLYYDCVQDTVCSGWWDLDEKSITNEKAVLLEQQDIDAIIRIEWNGNGHIILPKVSATTPFLRVNTDFFEKITEKESEHEVINGDWRCWRNDTGAVMLTNEKDTYVLNIDTVYELVGLTNIDNEIRILLWNALNGEVKLYHYDTNCQTGSLTMVSGFRHLMNSQLWPEQVAIESGQDFYFTDCYAVYFIDSEQNQASRVFSKNEFSDSLIDSDSELAAQIGSCWIRMGLYQNDLLVWLKSQDGMLDRQWLYYQGKERQALLELPISDTFYLLPNHE